MCVLGLAIAGCASAPAGGQDSRRGRPRSPGKIPTVEELTSKAPAEDCKLSQWEDGDTAIVDCPSGRDQQIRLVGIDTAESGFDDNSKRRAGYQAEMWKMTYEQVVRCGQLASKRVKELCSHGTAVKIAGNERDKYGRRLGYVLCGEININERMVSDGWAGKYAYPADPEKPRLCPVPEK
ncbi:MAG: hypothetical protein GMKNLPBB_02503 [Myxococcota bacterium]|nr:hypothetical protein [Myxococcota bacterium]